MTQKIPTAEEFADHFGVPPEGWIDNSYAVSHSIAREFPELQATVIAGTWTGTVARDTHFRWLVDAGLGGKGISHWWLQLPDGTILDPTRWVFEGSKPYIYTGPSDYYVQKTQD